MFALPRDERFLEAGRTYDDGSKQSTFKFTLATNGENVSHVLLMTCPDIDVVSVSGPPGANQEAGPPKQDPSIEGEHVGIKFEPGAPGTYTIVFAANIAGAEFVVKDGTGHKHFVAGSDVCKTVPSPQNTESTTPTTVGGDTTPTTVGGETTPTTVGADTTPTTTGSNPGTEPASNQNGQPGTQVQGATATNNPPAAPAAEVLGTQLTQPEALGATLPRTGPAIPLLAPIGAMLVVFGGLATAIARRR